ncbi:hypothetical protein ACTFIY_011378 [Dictyostelium cf. discoideum]
MPPKPTYVIGGSVTQTGRSKWRLSYIPEFIWGILNQITFFFSTLIGGTVEPRRRSNNQGGGRRLAGFDGNGNVTGGSGVGGSGPSKGPDNGTNNRRGDMKNILACNSASGS